MPQLHLTPQQCTVLEDVLQSTISDLGMEIADTDRMEFRDQLKERRGTLTAVLETVRRATAQGPGSDPSDPSDAPAPPSPG